MKFLIAGLGNIGDEYANTRHNIGFAVLDALAASLNVSFLPGRYASVANAKFKGKPLVMIKPATYMNLSGKAVRYWLEAEKIPIENLLIVSDDLDLDSGVLRMKRNGSGGSHNGLNHIIEILGTTELPRLRFGIGGNFAKGFQVDYVLGQWTKTEEKILTPKVLTAVEMIKSFTTIGIDRTMNLYNNR
ncbi:MAG: aminoacyl-tRNA hydrolase [Bacteroidales bacterium]|nr:aminoacyl-tRNA hydrolase [Bacteroidales bacterium]MDZ4203314.1 aminoacyl-tRNA hydrolase [Bacteroidales bacterium]